MCGKGNTIELKYPVSGIQRSSKGESPLSGLEPGRLVFMLYNSYDRRMDVVPYPCTDQ